jgi:hypothetical protein
MAKNRMREVVSGFPGPDDLRAKMEQGWRLVALEWEREAEEPVRAPVEEVPFGLKVADDCLHLEEDPDERQALRLMLDLIVDDEIPLSRVSSELNEKGFRTRSGSRWTQAAVFDMLPRLIESAPRIFSTSEWAVRKRHYGGLP